MNKQTLVRTLIDHGMVLSFAEARRLIGQNCVKVNNKVAIDLDVLVESGDNIQVGNKKRFKLENSQILVSWASFENWCSTERRVQFSHFPLYRAS